MNRSVSETALHAQAPANSAEPAASGQTVAPGPRSAGRRDGPDQMQSVNGDCSGDSDNIQQQLQRILVGDSPPMRHLFRQIARVAPTSASVLITGESGTGKELVAQAIHQFSARGERPFLPINCGAIPAQLIESELFGHVKGSFTGATRDHSGYFERANGGTLFLDEITEMPFDLQVNLLRVLETSTFARVGGSREHTTDTRIIAATNRDPVQAVEDGDFREDLLYRIQVFPVHLPPLRERNGDIELLARHFLEQYNRDEKQRKALSDEAVDALCRYSWPGNLRELKNVVQRSCIMAETCIEPEDLPAHITLPDGGSPNHNWSVPVGRSLAEMEKKLILATLDYCGGRKEKAARMLGICPKTLYNRLREYQRRA
ncbi:sigma-54 interaction domain-containing protein [Kineobactrum salinum]|uniref:Sigma-54-dependent Fis family transcriptional regulator n=1 Tax=Kineobactrum salinum TaxID=2708301 RepID=A0A6C0U4Y2_9GAMM|nr:sigma-54 dependent transcriptional regulator [Kineobactrum salinum]QIB67220.1 sigma-54-dependent Fis family transcriptional regulator [Kineobactrum salinum]